jgi:heme-degrading monooxygenase HmoA
MISRHWRGVARVAEADNYVRHLQHDTFPQLSRILGFVSASILRRPAASGVEFLVVTTWQSMDAIRQFAGDAPEVAVVPPAVLAMMVEHDATVAHYQIVETYRPE